MSVRFGMEGAILRFVSVRAGFSFVTFGFVPSWPPSAAGPDTDATKPRYTKCNLERTDANRKITPSIPTRTDTEHL